MAILTLPSSSLHVCTLHQHISRIKKALTHTNTHIVFRRYAPHRMSLNSTHYAFGRAFFSKWQFVRADCVLCCACDVQAFLYWLHVGVFLVFSFTLPNDFNKLDSFSGCCSGWLGCFVFIAEFVLNNISVSPRLSDRSVFSIHSIKSDWNIWS